MKYSKYLLLTILHINITWPGFLFCQGLPVINQHVYFPQTFNPSRYGDGFFLLNYRRQWIDITDGVAPVTVNFNADLTNSLNLESKKIALGFGFTSDKAHLSRNFDGNISFGYSLVESENTHLSLGIIAGILSQRIRIDQDTRFDDILQNFEGSSILMGTAGPGLFYRAKGTSENVFEFDASLPRLYSSANKNDAGTYIDVAPHLLLRTAFKLRFGASTFEPVILYRKLLSGARSDFSDKGSLDFAFRGGFFDDRFWLGLGSRLHFTSLEMNQFALPLQVTFGASAFDRGTVVGSFDLNSNFGTSFEVGLFYSLKEKDTGISRNVARNEIKEYADDTERIWSTLSDTITKKLVSISNISDNIKNLGRSVEPVRVKKSKIKDIEKELSSIENWRSVEIAGVLSRLKGYNDKRNHYQLNKLISKKSPDAEIIEKRIIEVENSMALISKGVKSNKDELEALKLKLPLELYEIIRSNPLKMNELDSFLNNELATVTKRPRNMERIKVERNAVGFSIVYQFPNALEKYFVAKDPDLDDIKSLLNFSGKMNNEFINNGVTVDSISFTVLMREDESVAEKIKRGVYRGEFGAKPEIKYIFKKNDNNSFIAANKILKLQSGISTNLVQMALLKLYSMKDFLESNHIQSEKSGIELISPNVELKSSQQFKIVIYYKYD